MFQTRLVGISFRPPDIQEMVEELEIGDDLELVREPDNPYDSNAIQLHRDGEFLGYVRGTDAQEIAPLIDEERDFIATVIEGGTPRQPKVAVDEITPA